MGCNAWNHPPGCDCGWGGDTGGGGGWYGDPSDQKANALPSPRGVWGRYETSRLQSYTIPNAHCPVCGARVFFYQSEYGGRVFFDPPLGPPWPKHPCTDNRADIHELVRQAFGSIPSEPSADSKPSPRADNWHPLLSLKLRPLGKKWFALTGFDPIDEMHCEILTRADLVELAPTFVQVKEPHRLTCKIEQVRGGRRVPIEIVGEISWFGVNDLEGARVAKRAKSGDVAAMRAHATAVSYRHLGSDNWVSDVRQFLDLRSALYLFEQAEKLGSCEAGIEHAYLLDLIEIDEARLTWIRKHSNVSLRLAPEAFHQVLSGRLAHSVCVRIEQVLSLRETLAEMVMNGAGEWAKDYIGRQIQPLREYLEQVASRPFHPRLNAKICSFLDG